MELKDMDHPNCLGTTMPLCSNRPPSLGIKDLDLGPLRGVSELVAQQSAGTRNAKQSWLCPSSPGPAGTGAASRVRHCMKGRSTSKGLLKRDLHYLAD